MKIMQINAWQGRLLRPLLDLIAVEDPDLIFAQEMYSYPSTLPVNSPWNYFGTTAFIAAQNEYEVYFSPSNTFPMFGEQLAYGNAIFSKFPFSHTSTHYTGGPEPIHLATAEAYDGNPGRNFQHAVIEISGKPLNLINHHGHWVNHSRGDNISHARLQQVASYVKGVTGPAIFAGDLNLSPDSPAFQDFLSAIKFANPAAASNATSTLSPAHYVKQNIICDYILTSPALKTTRFEVSPRLVSDHRALIAQIEM